MTGARALGNDLMKDSLLVKPKEISVISWVVDEGYLMILLSCYSKDLAKLHIFII